MKAVTYKGTENVQVKEVQDAALKNSDDILVQITNTQFVGLTSIYTTA